MSKLISANFSRLFKSFIFKLYMAFSCGLSVFVALMRYIDVKKNWEAYKELSAEYRCVDGIAFVGAIYLLFAVAVFVGIFIGADYSDGTIRNKMMVGHTRTEIYFSNLLVCTVANAMALLLNIIVMLTLGGILCGIAALTVKSVLLTMLYMLLAFTALTAIALAVSMLIQSKAAGSVTLLIMAIVLFCAALTIDNALRAPEYYEGEIYLDEETGEIIEGETTKNPNYLTGTKRKVYEFFNDVLPSSQLYRLAVQDDTDYVRMVVGDLAIIALFTGMGITVFRKKDLK